MLTNAPSRLRRCLCVAIFLAAIPALASTAQAKPDVCISDCREARGQCKQERRNDYRLCRDDCRDQVREAIADAREHCEIEGLDEKTCRPQVITAVRAVASSCFPECRTATREAKRTCRSEARECFEDCRGPLDADCRDACHDDFKPCAEAFHECRIGCRSGIRDELALCRENATNRSEFRECAREVFVATRECHSECHDTNQCGEQIRECLDSCVIPEA